MCFALIWYWLKIMAVFYQCICSFNFTKLKSVVVHLVLKSAIKKIFCNYLDVTISIIVAIFRKN